MGFLKLHLGHDDWTVNDKDTVGDTEIPSGRRQGNDCVQCG